MGTFYGGISHTPLSSLVLVCELAGSYDLLVPLMLAEGIAFVALRKRSLYRAQVPTQRDSPAHQHATFDVLRSTRVGAVMRMMSVSGVPIAAPTLSVRADADLRTAAETMLANKLREIPVHRRRRAGGRPARRGRHLALLPEGRRRPAGETRRARRPGSLAAVSRRRRGRRLSVYFSFSFLARNSAIMTSRACLGTSAYFWNSIVNSPLPWVAERRSVE